jgi:hypothetical protein
MMFVWGAQAQFVPSKGNGPGNSAGYQGNGPRDGSGYGAKAGKSKRQGGGICDQTGPKGPRGAQSGAQRGGRGRR